MRITTARDIIDSADLILFDLDGTLVDSVPDLASAINDMLCTYGMVSATLEQVSTWVGNGAEVLVERALKFANNAPIDTPINETAMRVTPKEALTCFLDAYDRRNGEHTSLYAGAVDLLNSRNSQNKAIVTNKPYGPTLTLLSKLNIIHHFSAIAGGDTFENKKPHPQPLLELIKQHNAQRPVLVGDSVNDISAAQAAGVPVIAVSYGYNHGRPITEENPDWVVDSLAELL